MPLYLHPINLFIKKSCLEKKYPGGINAFLEDYGIRNKDLWHQDNQLLGICSMGVQDFNLAKLEENGFNVVSGSDGIYYAEDFVILNRHFNEFSWNCNWLEHNLVFAWHIDAKAEEIQEAKNRSKCPWNEIEKRYGKWENFFQPIVG